MDEKQIEVLEFFDEVLTHMRQQFDLMIEHGDAHFAMEIALNSGSVMVGAKIEAAKFLLHEKEASKDREKMVLEWSLQYRRDCDDFCKTHDLPARVKNPLMRFADLTKQSTVTYTTIDGRANKRVKIPLRPRGVPSSMEVDNYPSFIDIVQEIVTGERAVGQIGNRYRNLLGDALLAEWDKYVQIGKEKHREMQNDRSI
jgi:hypothetical protein